MLAAGEQKSLPPLLQEVVLSLVLPDLDEVVLSPLAGLVDVDAGLI